MTSEKAKQQIEIIYPESDGKPIGETGFHVNATLSLFDVLLKFFYDEPEVLVAADLFLYYEEGNPEARKAPDIMVVKGVEKGHSRVFKTWEENAIPCLIFEITYDATRFDEFHADSAKYDDLHVWYALYAALGVHEYFIFDPDEERPESRFCGFRLRKGRYVPIPPEDSEGRRFSQELGTWVVPDGTNLRVIAPQTGSPLLNAWEAFTYANDEPMRTEREARTHGSMLQRRN